MKPFVIILFLSFSILCQSQESTELKPPFNNQGEQENYWSQELFKKEYKKRSYKVYTNEIKNINEIEFIYDNKSFNVYTTNNTLKLIFTEGILYPQLLTGYTTEPRKSDKELDSLTNIQRYIYESNRGDNLTISNLEELKFLSNSPKVKRFRFWLSSPGSANPQVCLFELMNEKATKKTNLEEFIKNSKLTFWKAGWIVI